jgi:hypothetical protein
MKLCISVGLLKVKVGLVLRVMKTLLELMLVEPNCARAGVVVETGTAGVEGVERVEGAEGVAGADERQTDGCPLQMYPVVI